MPRIGTTILAALLLAATAATAQDQPEQSQPLPTIELTPMQQLQVQIDSLLAQMADMRKQVAEAQLEAAEAKRELAELRQFIDDRDQLGDDFAEYTAIKAIAEREARERENARRRAAYEAKRVEQRRRRAAARAEKENDSRDDDRIETFRRAGFGHIGLDVLTSKMAYYYDSEDNRQTRLDFVPGFGYFEETYGDIEIDYSKMTISGSIVNAADVTRNLGVAIVFFDEYGNQVGHESIQIANARPDVPYPFTSKVDMALNRTFSSSSTYVLYADPIRQPQSAPTPQTSQPPQQTAPAQQPTNAPTTPPKE